MQFKRRKTEQLSTQIFSLDKIRSKPKAIKISVPCCLPVEKFVLLTLRKRCPYSELFWSAFFPHFPAFGLNTERYSLSLRIQSECGNNADQNNSEYGLFLRSVKWLLPYIHLVVYIRWPEVYCQWDSGHCYSKWTFFYHYCVYVASIMMSRHAC